MITISEPAMQPTLDKVDTSALRDKKRKNNVDLADHLARVLQKPLKLQNRWCFWHNYYIGPGCTVEEYNAQLHNLCTIGTVQEFWSWYNHLPAVNELRPRSSYHLMKEGIRPLWEDEANENGGNWTIKVSNKDTSYVWLELLLAVIGEQFSTTTNDEICGVTVSIRADGNNCVEIWNKNVQGDTESLLQQTCMMIPMAQVQGTPSYKVHKEEGDFKTDFKHRR